MMIKTHNVNTTNMEALFPSEVIMKIKLCCNARKIHINSSGKVLQIHMCIDLKNYNV